MSLKEQLLKAGLIDEKKARQTEHHKRQEKKKADRPARETAAIQAKEQALQQAEAQREKDRALNLERQRARAEKEALHQAEARDRATLEKIYADGLLDGWEGHHRYYYLHGNRVEPLMLSEHAARKLEHGQAAVVAAPPGKSGVCLVTAGAARRLQAIYPEKVLTLHPADA